MTNHTPTFTSSSASGSFTENANTTGSTVHHNLSGTMAFKDADKTDTHTTTAALKSAVWSGGSGIPAASLADFSTAMSSHIVTDSNGSGTLQWSFSDADDDFDFLAKNETLVLTYNITVSDNHGGSAIQTVKVTVTGTDDAPLISMATMATVMEQPNHLLSLTPDTAHVAVHFVDPDLDNTAYTATVLSASATGATAGLLPGALGTAELMSFFNVDNVVKAAGSSSGTINTTFSAPDLAFDYLASGQQLVIDYKVQLDDHAGGVTTQDVLITVIGTNDKPIYLSGPETAHLIEGTNVSPAGNLTAHADLFFTDVDLSDTHTVSTTVTAVTSNGSAIPISNADLLAALHTTLEDSTGHLLGEVDADFALANSATNFLGAGNTLTLDYTVTVTDPAGGSASQHVIVTILGTNHPVVITSGPESASLSELSDTTGSSTIDQTSPVPTGTLNFTDQDLSDTHTVAVSVASAVSSGGIVPAATQADLATALATTLHDSTGTGTGGVDWTFGTQDHDFDFLGATDTLTVTYNVKVSDASTSATQTVTVTVQGANDAPVITSGPGAASLSEQPNVTGSASLNTTPTATLSFTDPDLTDTHTTSVTLDSAVWSFDPSFIPADTFNDLLTALHTTLHDSTGTGSGGIDWTFSIPDKDLDFLGAGDTLTVTYDVGVADNFTGATQQVTITIAGAQDPLTVNPVTATVTDTIVQDAGNIVAAGNLITDGNDTGGDQNTTLSVTDVNGHAVGAGFTDIAGTYGDLLVAGDGTYLYVANSALDALQAGQNPTDAFNFTVTDSLSRSVATTLTFNVVGANDAPVITASDTSGSMTEDAGPTVIVNGGFETGDLTGWTASDSHISVQFVGDGGELGNFAAKLAPTAVAQTLSQDVSTTPGQHYVVSFFVTGDPDSSTNSMNVSWDGTTILALSDGFSGGFTRYSFDVVGDATHSTTSLQFTYTDDGTALFVDQVAVDPATAPPTENANGTINFTDETADTHTVSFVPQGSGYLGTFSLDPVSDGPGSGSVGWHFTVNNADIQFLSQGQALTEVYTVSVTDNHGASTTQDVTITINGTNDAPTAVGETVVTDVDTGGTVHIPTWALALNDTDPDMLDTVAVHSITGSSGGTAGLSGDAFFTDDATLGGSFTYNVNDNHGAVSSNAATATIVNNVTGTTTLTGTGGDDILIATNGSETLVGGAGNDILIGNSGTHTLTGGAGNDVFAFLHTDNVGIITDFNNTTEQDRIAVSASGYGGGLTAGMDVTPAFETSGDDQFSGFGPVFHFDTANQTLYFAADGTNATAITVAQLQAGVTLHAHDILIV